MSNTIKTDVNAEVGNILILHMKGKMMIGEAIRQIEKLYHAQFTAQKEEPKEGEKRGKASQIIDILFEEGILVSQPLFKKIEQRISKWENEVKK